MIDYAQILAQKQALEKQFSYKFQTTFWDEFSIAEQQYGPKGIIEHYNLVFDQWKGDVKFLSELVLVLNWKIYQWYQVEDTLGLTYDALWRKSDAYAMTTLKDDDLHYYLSVLD